MQENVEECVNEKDVFTLIYTGPAVDDGTIDAADLIKGLAGLRQVTEVVANSYYEKKNVSLRFGSFRKGSFISRLLLSLDNPYLSADSTLIVAVLIWQVALIIRGGMMIAGKKAIAELRNQELELINKGRDTELMIRRVDAEIKSLENEGKQLELKQKHKEYHIKQVELEKTRAELAKIQALKKIFSNPDSLNKVRNGYKKMASPLKKNDIRDVKLGFNGKQEIIMNQTSKHHFLADTPDDIDEYRQVTLYGNFRSLDKKTLRGKFAPSESFSDKKEQKVPRKPKEYPVVLAMNNPEAYFHFFTENYVELSGEGVFDEDTDDFSLIKVKDIKVISETTISLFDNLRPKHIK